MRRFTFLEATSWVLAALLLSAASSRAAEPFRIESELATTSIVSYAEYLEDPESELTLEDVLRDEVKGRFLPPPQEGLSFGHSPSTWWVRISLENAQDREADLVLRSGTTRVDEIQAHLLWPDGTREVRKLGDRIPPADRLLPDRLPILELTLPAHSSLDVVYRVRSKSSIRIPIEIASRRGHLLEATVSDYTVAALHGAIIGLLVLNLFFFVSLREPAFLWYSLCSGGMVFYMLGSEGFGPFLLPVQPLWDQNGPVLVGSATVIAMVMFARSYLRTAGWLDRVLMVEVALIGACSLALFGFGESSASPLNPLTTAVDLLAAASLPFAALLQLRDRAIEARFFLFAWSFLLAVMVAFAVDVIGFDVLGSSSIVALAYLALAFERVGSGLGLAHRVYTIRTERTEAQAAAAAGQARYQRLIEHSPLGVVVVDRDLRVTHVNSAFGEILDVADVESLLGLSLAEPGPNISSEVIQTMRTCIECGRVSLLEPKWVTPRGRELELRIHYSPVPDAQGEVVGCQALVEDITEEHSLRSQLHQAQKLEAVARLAGGVAHDFNNYLTSILGFSELLLEAEEDAPPERASLEVIHDAATRSANVARQLLAFSRSQTVQPRVFAIGPVVERMGNLLGRMVGEDVSLAIRSSDADLRVRMDPTQLEQVLANLVVNARDAMPKGGRIEITVEGGRASAEEVVLSVTDTGEGMDLETQERIFDPFFTTKEIGKGTGLGLATVHGVVEQSGGRVEVTSTPGQGTTFRILLPRTLEEAAEPTAAAASPKATSARVLVVDDDEGVRTLLCRVLRKAGHEVEEACSGHDALERTTDPSHPLDLLVSDVVMPEMSGLTLRKRLAERFPRMRALYVSGYTERDELEEIARSKDQMLAKPFTAVQLVAAVQRSLERR